MAHRLRNEPSAWLHQRANSSISASFRSSYSFSYLFISPTTTTTSPPWPPRWKQRRWWNEIISLPLFSLSSHRHSSPLDSFYFIRCLFWLFSWCGAWSHRPQNITSTIKPICSVRGSHIWQITYTSTVELLPRQDVMETLIIQRCERQ